MSLTVARQRSVACVLPLRRWSARVGTAQNGLTAAEAGERVRRCPTPRYHQEDDSVIVRARYLVAAAVGLCAAHLLPAQEPPRLGLERNSLPAPCSANQQLADAVARQLRQGGRLRDYRIDLVCREGLVELSGSVTDQPQREEALRLVQGVPGVERVLDRLTLTSDAGVTQAQAGAPPAPLPVPSTQPPEVAPRNGAPAEPMPLFQGPPPPPYDLNPPRLPPYA